MAQDFLEKGDASPYADMFIDWSKFWDGALSTLLEFRVEVYVLTYILVLVHKWMSKNSWPHSFLP